MKTIFSTKTLKIKIFAMLFAFSATCPPKRNNPADNYAPAAAGVTVTHNDTGSDTSESSDSVQTTEDTRKKVDIANKLELSTEHMLFDRIKQAIERTIQAINPTNPLLLIMHTNPLPTNYNSINAFYINQLQGRSIEELDKIIEIIDQIISTVLLNNV